MAFDGVNYSGAWTFPPRHHPKAGMTGPAIANPLRNSYYHARQHNRLLLCQSYASNVSNSGSTIGSGFLLAATAYRRLTEVSVYIPPQVTDVFVSVTFGAITIEDSTAYTRAVLSNGGGADVTGTATESPVLRTTTLAQAFRGSRFDRNDPYLARCVVKPAAYHLDTTTTLYAEAYIIGASGAAQAHKPFNVTAWWEVLG